jgi:RNA polymerase sigma-70 factor (ECF subfamily)
MAVSLSGSFKDRELVARFLRRQDEMSFLELYRRHAPSLNQMIVRLLRGFEDDVEDVIQITWIRAIERLSEFRWESTLRTWLTGIAINCSREHIRRSSRIRTLRFNDALNPEPSRKIERPIDRIDLEHAIAKLPDGYREVLILHDIEGFTPSEIAAFLNIEEGTSKSQLSRARGVVRSILTEKERNESNGRSKRRAEQRGAGGFPLAEGDAKPIFR